MSDLDAPGMAEALEQDAAKLRAMGHDPYAAFPDGKYTAGAPSSPLPCPFCGTKADLDYDYPDGSYSPYWRVGCEECRFYRGHENSQAEAIAAWNRRAPSETAGSPNTTKSGDTAMDDAALDHKPEARAAENGKAY